MGEDKPEYRANECYEALLDLKSIFPTWSDTQNNFNYHWSDVLTSTTKGAESEKQTVQFYLDAMKPLIESKGEGIEAQTAIDIVSKLDERRKERDNTFTPYKLEDLLSKDTSAIKPKPIVKKQPAPRRPAAEITSDVISEGGHAYGTRTRSRKLRASQTDDGDGAKLEYSSSGFGTHLKKGFFSDYVWDFLVPTGEENEYDKETERDPADNIELEDDGTPKRAKRSRK
ncbi:hypothetical protein BBOV_II003710 [Babesia bovis T2Bo]|uniref:Uncharacterized protein n=1 Tax=Babesia bovis TaxID=5865 RepID=A7ATR5_BABBO|nr:hypothetical protein BBOV_II003710 [Babesia bovis T2Bo]EDO06326.1 hypothetical protein BBOV_II003710 [Babesia bovis T2Bo]|eukprot:XP_001609894.1 hypothetical protein [Babesia bovis T2Bo]